MTDKREWVWQMSKAMESRNYDDIKVLCQKVVDVLQEHEPCCSFCPFVSICDWMEHLTGVLPDGTNV